MISPVQTFPYSFKFQWYNSEYLTDHHWHLWIFFYQQFLYWLGADKTASPKAMGNKHLNTTVEYIDCKEQKNV